jgi:hypothetical protein
MNVYEAINAVQSALSKIGIGKDRVNEQQRYKFRGIDDVYNVLSPLMAECGLCILPRYTERTTVERATKSGTALFYVTVKGEFEFVSVKDGSKHVVGPMYGEAMDSGDKATNKAMSAAYKYACMQAFSIPTEGDNDEDAKSFKVTSTAQQIKGRKDPEAVIKPVDSAMQGTELDEGDVSVVAGRLAELAADEGTEADVALLAYWESIDNDMRLACWREWKDEPTFRAKLKARLERTRLIREQSPAAA